MVVLGRRNIGKWYTAVLDKLTLIRVDLPPMDRELHCQTSSFSQVFLAFCSNPPHEACQQTWAPQGILLGNFQSGSQKLMHTRLLDYCPLQLVEFHSFQSLFLVNHLLINI
jgi:hypothetical protein